MKKQRKDLPSDGAIYQRKKGRQYRVVRTAQAEPDGTTVVVYEPVVGGEAWTIPLKDFAKRFRPVVADATRAA
jgi:hypothetical protein